MITNSSSRKIARGFTLIELLVVIAIIAILAAILFPVFAQAKLAAKRTTALANAKQVGMAHLIYMNDYDDHLIKEYFGFPAAPTCDWGSMPWSTPNIPLFYSWRYALLPYVAKSNGLMQDSTNPFSKDMFWTTAESDGLGDVLMRLPSNFAVNNAIIGFADGECAGGPWTPDGQDTLNGVDEPAGTILFLPNRSQWNDLKWMFGSIGTQLVQGPPDLNDTSWCITAVGASSPTCPAYGNGPIHAVGKQVSWVWGDGHAKSKPYAQTLAASDPDRDDWATKLAINPTTSLPWTQADRQYAAAHLFPEYQ